MGVKDLLSPSSAPSLVQVHRRHRGAVGSWLRDPPAVPLGHQQHRSQHPTRHQHPSRQHPLPRLRALTKPQHHRLPHRLQAHRLTLHHPSVFLPSKARLLWSPVRPSPLLGVQTFLFQRIRVKTTRHAGVEKPRPLALRHSGGGQESFLPHTTNASAVVNGLRDLPLPI